MRTISSFFDSIVANNNLEWFGRCSLAVIYIWFGGLKLIGAGGPAADLVAQTIPFGDDRMMIALVGVGEIVLGALFLIRSITPYALLLLFIHMVTTLTPLIMVPSSIWIQFPLQLTIEGQYIIKNLCLIATGLCVWKEYRRKA